MARRLIQVHPTAVVIWGTVAIIKATAATVAIRTLDLRVTAMDPHHTIEAILTKNTGGVRTPEVAEALRALTNRTGYHQQAHRHPR